MRKTRDVEELRPLCDGNRTTQEIADILGWPRNTVKNMVSKHKLPRRKPGDRKADRCGENNPAFLSGRRICRQGYVYVSAPEGHPQAYVRPGRKIGTIRLHRLLIEEELGRYLEPEEVVDHVDGLTLHNEISNLRLFANNGEHIAATLGKPRHSDVGVERMRSGKHLRKHLKRIDTHQMRVSRGDVRLRQILLAALKFGIDSPFLLGASQHLVRSGIDHTHRPNLERAYQELLDRYELDLRRSE